MAELRENVDAIAYDIDLAQTHYSKIPRETDIESLYLFYDPGAAAPVVATSSNDVLNPIDAMSFKFSYDDVEIAVFGRSALAMMSVFYPDDPIVVGCGSYRALATGTPTVEWQNWFGVRLPVRCPAKPGHWLRVEIANLGEAYMVETPAQVAWTAGTIYIAIINGSFSEKLAVCYEHQDALAALTAFTPPLLGKRLVGILVTCMTNRDATTSVAVPNDMNFMAQYPALQLTHVELSVGATELYDVDDNACEMFLVDGHINRCRTEAELDAAADLAGDAIGPIPFQAQYWIPCSYNTAGNVYLQLNADTADVMIHTVYGSPGPAIGMTRAYPQGANTSVDTQTGTVSSPQPLKPPTSPPAPGVSETAPTAKRASAKRPLVRFGR